MEIVEPSASHTHIYPTTLPGSPQLHVLTRLWRGSQGIAGAVVGLLLAAALAVFLVRRHRAAAAPPPPKHRTTLSEGVSVPMTINRASLVLDDGADALAETVVDDTYLDPTAPTHVSLFDYDPQGESGCVPLTAGCHVSVTRPDGGSGWAEGWCDGRHGAFPASYLGRIPIGRCTALHPWEAQEPDQLSFAEGDQIDVLSRGEGWWLGRRGEAEGLVPASYVQDDRPPIAPKHKPRPRPTPRG